MVKTLTVTSDSLTCSSADEIRSGIQIEKANFFLLKTEELEKKIKDKFICIGSVKVSKTIPDKIILELKNRQALYNLIPFQVFVSPEASLSAILIATESGFLVDIEGVIFQKANFETNSLPILFENPLKIGERLENDLIKKVVQVLENLKLAGIEVINVRISTHNLFLIGQNPQVIFKLEHSLDRQLASLQLIINQAKMEKQEIDFIDLRFDKPVVRYGQRQSNLRN